MTTLPFCLLDGFTTNPGDLSWETLEHIVSLTRFDRTPPEYIVERAAGCVGILTNKVQLSREILDQLPDCRAVFLLSTGVNVVDLTSCSARGIPVCNIPTYGTASVSELVFAYLFDWARKVDVHSLAVRKGAWAASEDFCFTQTPQRELRGLTLGLIGFGEIAQAVTRAAQGIGMTVLAATPTQEGKPDLGQQFCCLEEVLHRSDVVSLHCPLTESTENLIQSKTLQQMKSGAVLINTSRGGLVKEADLAEALQQKKLSAAYLDVLSQEPPPPNHVLPSLPRAHITPHIAWATRAARQRLLNELTANVQAWLDGHPKNVVNDL